MGFVNKSELDWELAVEDLEALIDLCEAAIDEVGEPVEEFAKSVGDSAENMLAGVKKRRKVTAKQADTIKNWTDGINKWMPED